MKNFFLMLIFTFFISINISIADNCSCRCNDSGNIDGNKYDGSAGGGGVNVDGKRNYNSGVTIDGSGLEDPETNNEDLDNKNYKTNNFYSPDNNTNSGSTEKINKKEDDFQEKGVKNKEVEEKKETKKIEKINNISTTNIVLKQKLEELEKNRKKIIEIGVKEDKISKIDNLIEKYSKEKLLKISKVIDDFLDKELNNEKIKIVLTYLKLKVDNTILNKSTNLVISTKKIELSQPKNILKKDSLGLFRAKNYIEADKVSKEKVYDFCDKAGYLNYNIKYAFNKKAENYELVNIECIPVESTSLIPEDDLKIKEYKTIKKIKIESQKIDLKQPSKTFYDADGSVVDLNIPANTWQEADAIAGPKIQDFCKNIKDKVDGYKYNYHNYTATWDIKDKANGKFRIFDIRCTPTSN